MTVCLNDLPTELYSAILAHVPAAASRQTVLSLTRALPYAPIPIYELFHSICIKYPDQAVRLYQRLRLKAVDETDTPHDRIDVSLWIHHFSVETWDVDADVLLNLIRLLPNLVTINVWIGPHNFAPEHLEDIFKPCMPKLEYLSLRFRPYVKKATYYQFLKGSYFDSTLLAISAWPPSPGGLPTVSVVQDSFVPDPDDILMTFAQPIVFFRLDLHLSLLVHSKLSFTSLKSLRFRIPNRPIVRPLTVAYLNPSTQTGQSLPTPRPFPPPLEYLDIATCRVSEDEIESLLVHFRYLKHLVLDGCTGLLKTASPQLLGREIDWWFGFGKRCALAGVKKARDREKALRMWYEGQVQKNKVSASSNDANEPVVPGSRRPRRGRRGLATATISIRDTSSPPRATPSTHSVSTTSTRQYFVVPKIHIVPPLPTLRSISLSPTSTENTPVIIDEDIRASVVNEFRKGWEDGIRVLWEKRSRLGMSFQREHANNGPPAKYLKFREGNEADEEEGFEGLEDIIKFEEGLFYRSESNAQDTNPVLCLGGLDMEVGGRAAGCGDLVGRNRWMMD